MNWTEANVVREVAEEGEPEAERTGSDSEGSGDSNADRPRRGGSMGAMAAFGSRRNSNKDEGEVSIDKVEEGFTGSKLIVLYVYCNSEDRKHARMTAATKKFEEEVLQNYEVATALQGCDTIKFNGEELDTDVRKAYKLSTHCPQLVLMDLNGKQLYRATASVNPETLAKMIEAAKARVQKQVDDR